MTCHVQSNAVEDVLEMLADQGFEGMADAIGILLNESMRLERQDYLGAGPYERTDERRGYANGFKPKVVRTRVGEIPLQVPQTRDGGFYPNSLEKGLRSERALKLALAEMYVQGVSTRKVAKITEQLCGIEVSSMQVSRAAQLLDESLSAWRDRPLGAFPYVFLDARYEKVREGGSVIDVAVLVAIGVDESGHRQVLGTSVALSEQEVHWRTFLRTLQGRGLHGVKLFISDAGLRASRQPVLPFSPACPGNVVSSTCSKTRKAMCLARTSSGSWRPISAPSSPRRTRPKPSACFRRCSNASRRPRLSSFSGPRKICPKASPCLTSRNRTGAGSAPPT